MERKQKKTSHNCLEEFYHDASFKMAQKQIFTRHSLAKAKHYIDSLEQELTRLEKESVKVKKPHHRPTSNFNPEKSKGVIASVNNKKNSGLIVKKDNSNYIQNIISEIPDPKVRSYVSKYHKIAMEEQKHFNIPASVKLAQAILETGSGTSSLAKHQNNHFGLKYWGKKYPNRVVPSWDKLVDESSIVNIYDDDPKDHFLGFPGVWHSYRFHSYFLAGEGSPYVKRLPKKKNLTYKDWCLALRTKSGKGSYATNKKYPETLIKIIEDNKLYKLDNLSI